MNLSNFIRKFLPFSELSLVNFIKQMYKRFPVLKGKKIVLDYDEASELTKTMVSKNGNLTCLG